MFEIKLKRKEREKRLSKKIIHLYKISAKDSED